jgi:tight adherence protein C
VLGFVGAIFVFGALFYVTFVLRTGAEASQAEDRLRSEWGSNEVTPKTPFYISLTRPLLKEAYLDMATGFYKPAMLEGYRRKIISAGLLKLMSEKEFAAAKFWLTVGTSVFALLMYLFAEEPPPPTFLLGAVILMFFLPDIHVNSARQNRHLEIRFAMPYIVDLLTLSMEAGLDFLGAVAKVVDRAKPSPLVEEFSILLKDIQLGKTRGDGMKSMAKRIDMKEMSSFVAVIVSADQMGASIGTALRGQSDSMRTERLARAEKLGAQASQKILFPLVLFILPAVMLMVFGPIILSMMGVQ